MKRNSPAATGGMLVLCVLAVVCVAVFATLTLVSARADRQLSRENADFNTAFYEAEYQAALRVNALSEGASEEMVFAVNDRMALSVRVEYGTVTEWKLIDTGELDTPDEAPLQVWEGE